MNTAECASLASCMLKTRGNFGLLENVTRTPWIGLTRNYHERCEPEHLSWQWRAKNSPEIQRCNKVCLKKKMCPKKRFFPRLKKGFIYTDVVACEGKKKPLTWSEYFSFLLPDNLSQKPPMATCRKLLEHRRRKCLAPEDYQRCVAGECWPLPTEWYGQGVLHISELALTQPPKKEPEEFQLCPPPDYMISKCLQVKLPECPVPKCVEETPKKRPYSQFKGADTDGSPPTLSLKCLVKYTPELLPHPQHLDKSVKISCRNYGEFKSVECPKQMFNRYMNVDFTSKNLLPIPTTSPEYGPLREVKKGVCGRQTLLRPPSIRNFSTGRPLMLKDYPEFIKPVSTSHLQPGCSAFRSDKLIDRAGMDSELLQKPLSERAADKHHLFAFTEEELLKHELDARKSEEPPEEKQRRLEAQKSKLQLLAEKKKSDPEKKMEGKTGSASEANGASSKRRLFHGLVDLEEVPYQRSRFHSSAIHLARKMSERGKGSKKNTVDDGKICSGCPGIRGAELGLDKTKGKCSVLKGGIKGRCRVDRPIGPNDRPNKLSMKCKPHQDSPCMRPRASESAIEPSFAVRSAASIQSAAVLDKWRSLNHLLGDVTTKHFIPSDVATKPHVCLYRNPVTSTMGRTILKTPKDQDSIQRTYGFTTGHVKSEVLRIFKDRYHGGTVGERESLENIAKHRENEEDDIWSKYELLDKQINVLERRRKIAHAEAENRASNISRKMNGLEKRAARAFVAGELRKKSLCDVRKRYFDFSDDSDSQTKPLKVKYVNKKFPKTTSIEDEADQFFALNKKRSRSKRNQRGLETLQFFQDKYETDSGDSDIGETIQKNERADNEQQKTLGEIGTEQHYKKKILAAGYSIPFRLSKNSKTISKESAQNENSTSASDAQVSSFQKTPTFDRGTTSATNVTEESGVKQTAATQSATIVTKRVRPTARRSFEKPRLRGITLESRSKSSNYSKQQNDSEQSQQIARRLAGQQGKFNDKCLPKSKIATGFASDEIPRLMKSTDTFKKRSLTNEANPHELNSAQSAAIDRRNNKDVANIAKSSISKLSALSNENAQNSNEKRHSEEAAVKETSEHRCDSATDEISEIGFHIPTDSSKNNLSCSDGNKQNPEREENPGKENEQKTEEGPDNVTTPLK